MDIFDVKAMAKRLDFSLNFCYTYAFQKSDVAVMYNAVVKRLDISIYNLLDILAWKLAFTKITTNDKHLLLHFHSVLRT